MVVGISAGPRILSFSKSGGENLLYHDQTGFGVGDWRMYGGHRFTLAPENDRSYTPDNLPCDATETPGSLLVRPLADPDGLRRSLRITPAADGFGIEHILENHGTADWTGALWAVTCIPGGESIIGSPATNGLRFWPGCAPESWKNHADRILIDPDGSRGKAGWHSSPAWLASIQTHGTLLIHSPVPPAREQCTDGGCNLEVFISKGWSEMETLGGTVTLAPGQKTSHSQRWYILRALPPGGDLVSLAKAIGNSSSDIQKNVDSVALESTIHAKCTSQYVHYSTQYV